jgi:DNA-binding beta-propeller fold protein YncE
MKTVARATTVVVLASTLTGPGCSFGESGVQPPLDSLFLPSGLAVDPGGDWLFVVNSNSDLRYNAGTVAAVDVSKAGQDRNRADWTSCPGPGYRPTGPSGTRFCCYDYHDPVTLNCDERGYVAATATVRIGSFGSTVVLSGGPQPTAQGGAPGAARRLFVAVRADPSVTYIDAQVSGSEVALGCLAEGAAGGRTALCDDSHKIQSGVDEQGVLKIPEEPYAMALDEQLGVLYVGHGRYGASVIDLCAGERPALVSVTTNVFGAQGQGVNGFLITQPGDPAGGIFALGRSWANFSAEVQTLFLDGADQPCQAGSPRQLRLIPASGFFPSAFYPKGMDIRGLVLSPDQQRAYLLHRNGRDLRGIDLARDNPAALLAIDRSPDAQGRPANRTVDVLEVCAGATELHWHNAGRRPQLYAVCFESGQIYVVDPDLMEVSAVINAGRGPTSLRFSPTDLTIAYLTGFSENNVSVIDLTPGSPTEHKIIQRIGFPTLRR